ncbi:hypothetical protein D1872_311420 [compost metagenome]
MNGITMAPIEMDALTSTVADPAFFPKPSINAGYVPASIIELQSPAIMANTNASE